MSDEDKLTREAAKGVRASNLLSDELMTEAFKGLEEAYALAWRSTTIDDVLGREKLFLAINIVGKVREHLQSVVSNGKLATAELRNLAQTAEAARKWENV